MNTIAAHSLACDSENMALFSESSKALSKKFLFFDREARNRYVSHLFSHAKKHNEFPAAINEFTSCLNACFGPRDMADFLNFGLTNFLRTAEESAKVLEVQALIKEKYARYYSMVPADHEQIWYLCRLAGETLDDNNAASRKENAQLLKENARLNRIAKAQALADRSEHSGEVETAGKTGKRIARKRNPALKQTRVPPIESESNRENKQKMFESIVSVTQSLYLIEEEQAHFLHGICAVDAIYSVAQARDYDKSDKNTEQDLKDIHAMYVHELARYRDTMDISSMYGLLQTRWEGKVENNYGHLHTAARLDCTREEIYGDGYRKTGKKGRRRVNSASNNLKSSSFITSHKNETPASLACTYRSCLEVIKKFRENQKIVRQTNSYLFNNSSLKGEQAQEQRVSVMPVVLNFFDIQVALGNSANKDGLKTSLSPRRNPASEQTREDAPVRSALEEVSVSNKSHSVSEEQRYAPCDYPATHLSMAGRNQDEPETGILGYDLDSREKEPPSGFVDSFISNVDSVHVDLNAFLAPEQPQTTRRSARLRSARAREAGEQEQIDNDARRHEGSVYTTSHTPSTFGTSLITPEHITGGTGEAAESGKSDKALERQAYTATAEGATYDCIETPGCATDILQVPSLTAERGELQDMAPTLDDIPNTLDMFLEQQDVSALLRGPQGTLSGLVHPTSTDGESQKIISVSSEFDLPPELACLEMSFLPSLSSTLGLDTESCNLPVRSDVGPRFQRESKRCINRH